MQKEKVNMEKPDRIFVLTSWLLLSFAKLLRNWVRVSSTCRRLTLTTEMGAVRLRKGIDDWKEFISATKAVEISNEIQFAVMSEVLKPEASFPWRSPKYAAVSVELSRVNRG